MCWREAYRGILPQSLLDAMNLEQRTASWTSRLRIHERDVSMALSGRSIVGVISWTPGHATELNRLYVAADSRGTGLAPALLRAAVGGRHAALWVFTGNARARRFYEKHSFTVSGEACIDEETGCEELRMVRVSTAD